MLFETHDCTGHLPVLELFWLPSPALPPRAPLLFSFHVTRAPRPTHSAATRSELAFTSLTWAPTAFYMTWATRREILTTRRLLADTPTDRAQTDLSQGCNEQGQRGEEQLAGRQASHLGWSWTGTRARGEARAKRAHPRIAACLRCDWACPWLPPPGGGRKAGKPSSALDQREEDPPAHAALSGWLARRAHGA